MKRLKKLQRSIWTRFMVASVLLITCLILVSYLFSAWYMVRTTESKLLEDYNAAMDFTIHMCFEDLIGVFRMRIGAVHQNLMENCKNFWQNGKGNQKRKKSKVPQQSAGCFGIMNYSEATVSAWNFFWMMAASIPATVPTRILYTPQEIFRGWRNWMEWQGGIFQEDMLF